MLRSAAMVSCCYVASGLSLPTTGQQPAIGENEDDNGLPPSCWGHGCVFERMYNESLADGVQFQATLDDGDDDDDELVDAWLWMAHKAQRTKERCMYTPALETVKYGLQYVGAKVRIVDKDNVDDMFVGVKKAISQGKRPLVMAIAFWYSDRPNINYELIKLRTDGAFLALYQTEPNKAQRIIDDANELEPDEIWDYSYQNIDEYANNISMPVRYIPAGYAPRLEVNVSVYGHNRDESTLSYMGMYKKDVPKYEKEMGKTFLWSNGIGTRDQLHDYLERYPMQLNLHKSDEVAPMEAFRMADLLSNKACVMSTPVGDKDYEEWKDLVHFAELNETQYKFERLKTHMRQCQKDGYELFKSKFDGRKLLRDSGLFEVWRPQ